MEREQRGVVGAMSGSGYSQTKRDKKAERRALKSQKLNALFSDNTVMFNRMKDQEKQLKEAGEVMLEQTKELRSAGLKADAIALQLRTRDETMHRMERELSSWRGIAKLVWKKVRGERPWSS